MKIRLTFELDDVDRTVINESVGSSGKASRKNCIHWIRRAVIGELETASYRSEDFDASEPDGFYRPTTLNEDKQHED